ncbi:hypothetical protein AB1M95_13600 [Sulfitobacter sp. LCG007]
MSLMPSNTEHLQSVSDSLVALAGNPVFALLLGGVISLWIWRSQTILSDRLNANEEKRKLYRLYLVRIENARGIKSLEGIRWQDDQRMLDLDAIHYEVRLIASKSVSECAEKVIIAIRSRFSSDEQWVISSDGKKRTRADNISFEVKKLVAEMRNELRIR